MTEPVFLTPAQYQRLEAARNGAWSRGLCGEFNPPTGDICTRPMDHDGPHHSGIEWAS